MDKKCEISFDRVRKMPPEESYSEEIGIFQRFVSSSDITRNSLIQAWQHYQHFASIRREINSNDPDKNKLFDPNELCFKAADSRCRILSGEDVYLKQIEKATYQGLFLADTSGIVGGQSGILLKGLTGNPLKKAEEFCSAMNNVGLKVGDIDKVV